MKDKNKALFLPAVALLFACSLQARAEGTDGYGASFPDKLAVGVANMTMGFLELPKNIMNLTYSDNILVGLTLGPVRGAFQGVTRTLVGVADFLTFPFSTSDFQTPGYPWERFSEDSRFFGVAYPLHWTKMGPWETGDVLRRE